jgi:hypothetical protein
MQKGANGADNPNGATIEVYASFLPGPTHILDFPAAQVTSILAYLGPGNDFMRIDPSVSVPATVYSGEGNDQVYAGSGPSTLIGGNGNDLLVGGPRNDIISAGRGTDYFVGGGGNDVITGGGGNDTLGLPATSDPPISYWNLNDGSGTVIHDSQGVQNGTFYAVGTTPDLTEQGPSASLAPYGAATAAGFVGSAKDYIGIANNAAFQVANGTVEFWFNAASLQGLQTLFAKASNGVQDVPLTIGLNGGLLVAQFGASGTDPARGGTIQATQAISANTWYHVAFTFGANGMALYLNGVLVGTSAFKGGLAMNIDPIVLGGSNATTPTGRGNPSGQVITNSFKGRIDEVALYGQVLDPTQIFGLMVNGPYHEGAGLAGAGLSGGLADYSFAYVNGVLQATDNRPASHSVTQIFGVGTIAFGDGTVAFVLNSGSPNTPNLTLAQAKSLAPDGKLIVIGNGNQILNLIKPASGVAWTPGALQTIGHTSFVPWTNGATTVRVISGQPATDPVAADAAVASLPTVGGVRAQPATAVGPRASGPIGAVAFERVDPSELLSLIRGSKIRIADDEAASPASDESQTLLFDEDTGALMLAAPSPSTSEPALLVDGLGEEWVFVPHRTAGASEMPGARPTRSTW